MLTKRWGEHWKHDSFVRMVVNVDSLLLVPSISIVASQLYPPRALGRLIEREREVQVKESGEFNGELRHGTPEA